MSSYTPTAEQQQAIELAKDLEIQRLKIMAYAGVGKTNTMILIAQAL